MGLVGSWTEFKGQGGRTMYVEAAFDPEWIYEAQAAVANGSLPTDRGDG